MSRWPYHVFVRPYLNTATVPRLSPFSYSCFSYPWWFVKLVRQLPQQVCSYSSASTIRATSNIVTPDKHLIENSKGPIL